MTLCSALISQSVGLYLRVFLTINSLENFYKLHNNQPV